MPAAPPGAALPPPTRHHLLACHDQGQPLWRRWTFIVIQFCLPTVHIAMRTLIMSSAPALAVRR